jgi:hypothetical protein
MDEIVRIKEDTVLFTQRKRYCFVFEIKKVIIMKFIFPFDTLYGFGVLFKKLKF